MRRRDFLRGSAASAVGLMFRRSGEPLPPQPPPPLPPPPVVETPFLDSLVPKISAPTGPVEFKPPPPFQRLPGLRSIVATSHSTGERLDLTPWVYELTEAIEYDDEPETVSSSCDRFSLEIPQTGRTYVEFHVDRSQVPEALHAPPEFTYGRIRFPIDPAWDDITLRLSKDWVCLDPETTATQTVESAYFHLRLEDAYTDSEMNCRNLIALRFRAHDITPAERDDIVIEVLPAVDGSGWLDGPAPVSFCQWMADIPEDDLVA